MYKNTNEEIDLSLENEDFFRKYNRKKIVAAATLGCKVNQYDTEVVINAFRKEGYEIGDFEDYADIYIINTCTVTSLGDRKSRQMIRRARNRNPGSIIAVIGCYAQASPEEASSIEGVDLVAGTKDRTKIVEYVRNIEKERKQLVKVENIMNARDFENAGIDSYTEHTRAYIKIQEGCTQFCAYCIIPYVRGPVRSKPAPDVQEEVLRLSRAGYKEIVLTGIHLASYGRDLKNTSLTDIIHRIHDLDGIERIRLGSLEPTFISSDFVNFVIEHEKLCPHFHISLQNGCDATLKRMNRKYTTSEYRQAVELIKGKIKDASITTDVMVGFPGETDEEFSQTVEFLKGLPLSKMHIFKYSRRKGTPAAEFKNQIPAEEKEHRSKILLELSQEKSYEFERSFEGRVMPVLFEQNVKENENLMEGLTPNYIRVQCPGNNKLKGEIADVKILQALNGYVTGEILQV